jgi:hypothetical protein
MLSAGGQFNFAHLGSHCDATVANMTILFANVEFSLYANAEDLPLLHDLPGYQACVQTLESAVDLPKEDVIAAHQALMRIVTESFWVTIAELSQIHKLKVLNVGCLVSRPRYAIQLSSEKFSIEGPFDSNPYNVRPLSVEAAQLASKPTTFEARELTFVGHLDDSPTLAGLVELPNHDVAWFKPSEEHKTANFLTELKALQRLKTCWDERQCARMPKLVGIVVVDNGSKMIGILTTAIVGRMLAGCHREERSRNDRRWRCQISESVALLHSLGIMWGDVNETNVIIDHNEEAWLIDLEGGKVQGEGTVPAIFEQVQEMDEVRRLFVNAGE